PTSAIFTLPVSASVLSRYLKSVPAGVDDQWVFGRSNVKLSPVPGLLISKVAPALAGSSAPPAAGMVKGPFDLKLGFSFPLLALSDRRVPGTSWSLALSGALTPNTAANTTIARVDLPFTWTPSLRRSESWRSPHPAVAQCAVAAFVGAREIVMKLAL